MTEHLRALLSPPTPGPASAQDLTSVITDSAQHFHLDLDLAPKAITAFRQAAADLRDLTYEAQRLANVAPPGLDAVSINAAKEIGEWAADGQGGSLLWSLESGSIQLEKAADALERSVATHQNTDEANAAQLRGQEL